MDEELKLYAVSGITVFEIKNILYPALKTLENHRFWWFLLIAKYKDIIRCKFWSQTFYMSVKSKKFMNSVVNHGFF